MDRELLKMAVILGLMSTIGPFAIDMYLPAMPDIAADFGSSVAAAQLTLTTYFFAFGVAQLFYGPASDMFGRKPPIYFGLVLFAIASIASAMAPTIEWLTTLRFFQGLGAAGVMSIPRAIIRDRYTGAKATRLMSTVMLVISVSPMLAPLVGSTIMVPFGWRAVFWAVTIASGISLLLSLFTLPETLQPKDRAPFELRAMLQSFGVLLRDANFVGLTLIGGLGMSAFFTFLGSAAFIYMDHFGLAPRQFAIAFAANAAGFFVATQFAANVMQRFGPALLIKGATLGYLITVAILFGIFLAGYGTLPIMIGMLLFSNLFMGLIIPSAMVLALEEHGPIAGAAASLGGTMQMLLGTFAMALGGILFNGGPLPMLAIIASAAALAFILALALVRAPTPQNA